MKAGEVPNRFVSKVHAPHFLSRREARTIHPSNIETLREATDIVRMSQRSALSKVADRNDTLEGFLNDPHISPAPHLNLDLSVHADGPLLFTISFFAPKSQNPTQTSHDSPDFAELAALIRFEELAKTAEERYQRPVRFRILAETTYAHKILGVDEEIATQFKEGLHTLSKSVVCNERVSLDDWYDTVSKLPGFHEEFDHALTDVKASLHPENTALLDEYNSIYPTVSNYLNFDPVKSREATLRLMAWNRARVACGEKNARAGFVYGSLTPGQDKFSFYSISHESQLYPHHGEGVLNKDTGEVIVLPAINIDHPEETPFIRMTSKDC